MMTEQECWDKLPEALNKMGFPSLRESQKLCLKQIFKGNNVFCVLPTGGGKTALAAIPTIVLNYQTIIFSPLIALMKDQADSLNRKGIRTLAVNSNQADIENYNALSDWVEGTCQVLLVAPERISHPQFISAINQVKPDLVVIDEAHTMSQWSMSFRPAYRKCGDFIQNIKPKQVLALTATATKEIIDDVKNILGLPDMVVECHYEERSNLHLSSSFVEDDQLFSAILKKVREIKGSVIVYCSTVSLVTKLTEFLTMAGESVTFYHGQMLKQTDKDMNQDEFMSGRARIMVATNAFGMGIDKASIEGIIHASPPSSLEAVVQEIGRAARDGRDAICHMYYSPSGVDTQEFFWNISNPSANSLKMLDAYLSKNKDKDNCIYKTIKEIEEDVQDESIGAALTYMTSLGCVERETPSTKIATIVIKQLDKDNLSKKQVDIIDCVKSNGERSSNGGNNNVYKVDLNLIAKLCLMTLPTLKKYLQQSEKEGHILYFPPFKGKITKVIRNITTNELVDAALRRVKEREKLEGVREYMKCPDKDKHKFLNAYFIKSLK